MGASVDNIKKLNKMTLLCIKWFANTQEASLRQTSDSNYFD